MNTTLDPKHPARLPETKLTDTWGDIEEAAWSATWDAWRHAKDPDEAAIAWNAAWAIWSAEQDAAARAIIADKELGPAILIPQEGAVDLLDQ